MHQGAATHTEARRTAAATMPLVLLVAADVAADKRNLELTFSDAADIGEIEHGIHTAYTATYPGAPFDIGKIQAYDEPGGRWVEVKHRSQPAFSGISF